MSVSARAARLLAVVWAATSLVVSGCATVPPGDRLAGDLISGRISIRVEATPDTASRAMNAAFELEGDAQVGKLNLASPLGTMLAQVSWSPGQAMLVTPQERSSYADLDTLTQKLLGESVPVGALFDWLRGRPWPAAESRANAGPAEAGFRQLGWQVNLASFDEALVSAIRDRAPVVTVRAKLDRN